MTTDFEQRAERYHRDLPGLVRATLLDHGVSDAVIDQRMLGFDGEHITVPVRNEHGSIMLFERWTGWTVGVPVDRDVPIELFGWDTLASQPQQLFVAEGILEALVLESQGYAAIAATGSGRFFKAREWGPRLHQISEVILAYKRGEKTDRRRHVLSRGQVIATALSALPRAKVLWWPKEVGEDGGALAYFSTAGRSRDDFDELLSQTT